jgi:hypothetical protein
MNNLYIEFAKLPKKIAVRNIISTITDAGGTVEHVHNDEGSRQIHIACRFDNEKKADETRSIVDTQYGATLKGRRRRGYVSVSNYNTLPID